MIAEPVTKNFTVPKGVDYPIKLRYLVNDVAVNLSGAVVTGAMWKHNNIDNPSIVFNSSNNNIYLDGDNYFGILLKAAQTSSLEATTYKYDIKIVLSGDTTRAIQGVITLTPGS